MSSSISNVIRQTQEFWADHHSITQAYNEAIDQAAGLVDTRLNENHSSTATRALVGAGLGAARVLGAIPLGINQWALDTVHSTLSHGALGPLYGVATFVSTPIKGMLDGASMVGRNLWSWANGSLSHKGTQAAADEVTTTLLTAALLVMGGRSMIKGGGEVAAAVRSAEVSQFTLPQWMQGPRLAYAIAGDSVSIRIPTRAAVANAGGPLGAGIVMMTTGKEPSQGTAEASGSAPRVLTQAEAIAQYSPEILTNGRVYTKFGDVLARAARAGEEVITRTPDGRVETRNTAKEGDFVLRNPTGEEYILAGNKLNARYRTVEGAPTNIEGQPYQTYRPTGQTRAVEITPATAEAMGLTFDANGVARFTASWGESMIVTLGDYLCMPLDAAGNVMNEVYRIERAAFAATYQ